MESVAEVLRSVGAIVSAFQTAADALEFIKERKEKKKRKREKEVEELLEIKILHKSLVEGGTRCRKHCDSRKQQFGTAFEIGDAIAVPALKDVVINIQTEIIQALHLARAVENAVLDLTALHESSVTNRKDATRAMDQLCQRIMASMQMETKSRRDSVEVKSPSASSLSFSYTGMQLSDGYERTDKSLPSLPSALDSPPSSIFRRPLPMGNHIVRQHAETALQLGQQRGRIPSPETRALQVIGLQSHLADNESLVSRPISSLTQEQPPQRSVDREVVETSPDSIHDSGLGSDRDSEHLNLMRTAKSMEMQRAPMAGIAVHQYPVPSVPAPAPAPEPVPPSIEPQLQTPETEKNDFIPDTAKHDSTPDVAKQDYTADIAKHDDYGPATDASPLSSLSATPLAATPLSAHITRFEQPEYALRGFEAPEVVAKDFGVTFSTLPIVSSPISPHGDTDKYLAFRTQADYAEALLSLKPGMDNIWAPLSRPAMHNRYHGFCKGAWQMRKAVSNLGYSWD